MFGTFTFTASPYNFKADKSSLPSTSIKREPLILTFPGLKLDDAPPDPHFGTSGDPREFRKKICSIKRLIDIKPDHLKAMNLKVTTDHSLDELIPEDYLHPNPSTERSEKLVNFYSDRAKELMIDNDVASDVLARIRREPKLGHFHRFYTALEMVKTYHGKDGPSTGMPERFREEFIKSFLEACGWAWGLRYLPPRELPKVAFGSSNFQVRMDLLAYVPPESQQDRRANIVVGPLFGVQYRHDEYFTYPGAELPPPPSPSEETPAAPVPPPKEERETPGSPPPSSKRHRSSRSSRKEKKEEKPVDEFIGVADEKTADPRNLTYLRRTKGAFPEGDVWDSARELGAILVLAQQRRKARKDPDSMQGKTRLHAYGRADERGFGAEGWWDEIFLVSSVHSHISISRCRISSAYLRFLESGQWPNPEHPLIKRGSEWAGIEIQRSKWWNLMVEEERVDAMWAMARLSERLAYEVAITV